jgi:hypothetical protein
MLDFTGARPPSAAMPMDNMYAAHWHQESACSGTAEIKHQRRRWAGVLRAAKPYL